jgi:hypothetical protein
MMFDEFAFCNRGPKPFQLRPFALNHTTITHAFNLEAVTVRLFVKSDDDAYYHDLAADKCKMRDQLELQCISDSMALQQYRRLLNTQCPSQRSSPCYSMTLTENVCNFCKARTGSTRSWYFDVRLLRLRRTTSGQLPVELDPLRKYAQATTLLR